jgi:endonuclease YncB( thermonuclease family)
VHGLILAAVLSSFNNVQVTRVYDGDTFMVNLPAQAPVFGENISVRILGIDTPEILDERPCARKAAQEARDALSGLMKGSVVDLVNCQRDKYFRLACEVHLDGWMDAGEVLLFMNLAVPYDGGTKPKWYCRRP